MSEEQVKRKHVLHWTEHPVQTHLSIGLYLLGTAPQLLVYCQRCGKQVHSGPPRPKREDVGVVFEGDLWTILSEEGLNHAGRHLFECAKPNNACSYCARGLLEVRLGCGHACCANCADGDAPLCPACNLAIVNADPLIF